MVKPTGNESNCVKDTSKRTYKRKRKYFGNQHTKKTTVDTVSDKATEVVVSSVSSGSKQKQKSDVTEDDISKTISHKKLQDISPTQSNTLDGFRLTDMSILNNLVGL